MLVSPVVDLPEVLPKKPPVEGEVGGRGGTSTKKSWISPVSKEGAESFLLVKEEEIDIKGTLGDSHQ